MTEPEKTGFLKRSKNFAQEKYAESKAKKEAAVEAERTFYEEAAAKYGRLVASELFASRRIELYDGGYVRVGGVSNVTGGPQNDLMSKNSFYVVAYDAPFEKLRAIKASAQVQDKSAGGRAVASVASFGLSKLASNENRYLFLTISTDRETYSLQEKGGMLLGQASMKLELAGQGILDALGSRAASAPATPAPGSVADQLRDLAALHRDGVLTDEEFAAAKAKLLGS
ncbi:MAG: SHOCT domain-containing protein [Mycobacteriales bacterium]